MITGLLANVAISDSARAERWYALLFRREPDAWPMPGLIEWHLGESFGVQLWVDHNRAGHSVIVMEVSDLDGVSDYLAKAGISHGGPEPGGGARILRISDPDGNEVVYSGK